LTTRCPVFLSTGAPGSCPARRSSCGCGERAVSPAPRRVCRGFRSLHRRSSWARGQRFTSPGLDRLPALDLLLISPSHYDHLDGPTLRPLARHIPVVVRGGAWPVISPPRFHHRYPAGLVGVGSGGWLEVTFVPAHHGAAGPVPPLHKPVGWLCSHRGGWAAGVPRRGQGLRPVLRRDRCPVPGNRHRDAADRCVLATLVHAGDGHGPGGGRVGVRHAGARCWRRCIGARSDFLVNRRSSRLSAPWAMLSGIARSMGFAVGKSRPLLPLSGLRVEGGQRSTGSPPHDYEPPRSTHRCNPALWITLWRLVMPRRTAGRPDVVGP
jgi:hypothetical protein